MFLDSSKGIMNPPLPSRPPPPPALIGICLNANAAIVILVAFFFFLIPGIIVIHQLSDPAIRSPGIPQIAWKLHQNLSPQFEQWATGRVISTRAAQLSTNDISGTEWPLFGAVFYLWATESLQQEWDQGHTPGTIAPKVYARDAIAAAAELVVDPAQANWVKIHWGNNYLKTQNVFYRMLVISALTSHARLTGSTEHLRLLRDQVESLSAELDASPHGLLDDYPGQCYPGDVLTAIAMIHRADFLLGTDHSAFIRRAIRGFQGKALDSRGLVPYFAYATAGEPSDTSRGCDNSYVCLFSPEIWPEQARQWYDLYAENFWQEKWTCAGFREFPKDEPGNNWYCDVDSGLVLEGFGCAACAFGVGAARVNGHFEQAYPLTAEMLATSWPLPSGTCLLPRLFSNAADAPYLGEAGILFNLTRLPAKGTPIHTGGAMPKFVVIFLALQLGFGLLLLIASVRSLRQWHKQRDIIVARHPELQFVVWLGLLAASALCAGLGQPMVAVLLLLCAQLLPRYARKPFTGDTPKPESAPHKSNSVAAM